MNKTQLDESTGLETKILGHWSESKGVNTPASNKAKHSPELSPGRRFTDKQISEMDTALSSAARELRETQSRLRNAGQRNGELCGRIESLEGECDFYKTQADKMAEALRDCETTPGALAERSHEYALRRLATITETAKQALAAYEAAQ